MDPRAALTWEQAEGGLGELEELRLTWKIEPNINILTTVVRRKFNIPESVPCIVEFLAQGTFNKVYTVQCPYIDNPIIFSYSVQCENDSDFDFEYIVMERVAGKKLKEQWKTMSWLKKEMVVRQVVSYLAQLFERPFSHIGSLYATSELQKLPKATDIPEVVLLGADFSTPDTAFCLSRIVPMPFFWGKHINYDVPHGPFELTREWLAAEIQLHLLKWSEAESPESDSDSDCEELTPEAYQTCAKRLLALLPAIFPEEAGESEGFVLHHGDINRGNILVDSNHNLSGLLGWECIHTVPTIVACEPPKFLYTDDRNEMPDPATYAKEVDEQSGEEVLNQLYFEHLEEYKKTQLRKVFIKEMQRVCQEWVQELPKNRLKAAFVEVVGYLGEAMWAQLVDEWVTKVEKTGDGRSIVAELRGAAFWN